jgi:hypothetical protein
LNELSWLPVDLDFEISFAMNLSSLFCRLWWNPDYFSRIFFGCPFFPAKSRASERVQKTACKKRGLTLHHQTSKNSWLYSKLFYSRL